MQVWVGGGLCVLGVGFLASPLLGAPVEVMFGSIGPLMAGSINLGVGLTLRKRLGLNQPATVHLTPEARELLAALVRKYSGGWPWEWHGNVFGSDAIANAVLADGINRRLQRRVHRRLVTGTTFGSLSRMPAPEISSEVLEVLEKASFQFNRIAGAVVTSAPNNAAMGKVASRVTMASDEGMAEVLHLSALLSRYPEGGATVRTRLQGAIRSLTELAERIEVLAVQEPSFTERVGYRTGMDDVLEELRLEQIARSELRSERSEQTHLNG